MERSCYVCPKCTEICKGDKISRKDMIREALTAGYYHSPGWNQDYPAIQILTIADLLDRSKNIAVKMPPQHGTFKEAQKVKHEDDATQLSMLTLSDEDLSESSQDD